MGGNISGLRDSPTLSRSHLIAVNGSLTAGDGTEGNFDQLIDWKLYILLLSTFLAQNKGIDELSGEFDSHVLLGQTITRSLPLTTNFPGRFEAQGACAFGDLHQFCHQLLGDNRCQWFYWVSFRVETCWHFSTCRLYDTLRPCSERAAQSHCLDRHYSEITCDA